MDDIWSVSCGQADNAHSYRGVLVVSATEAARGGEPCISTVTDHPIQEAGTARA